MSASEKLTFKENGGPAFPVQNYEGLTVRDYFAAQAMQGIASNPDFTDWSWEVSAEQAYKYADAMLEARK